MTKKIKISLILTSVVLLIVAVSTAGVSFALWTTQGGIGDGANSVTPTVIADQEYVWAKYFNFEKVLTDKGDNEISPDAQGVTVEHRYAVVTTFYDANAGVNLEDVIIPSKFIVMEDGVEMQYVTTRISNQIFMDSTLKKLPVTIYIPTSVIKIDAGAFSNLPNLQKVVFLGSGELNACEISEFAFAGCNNLVRVETRRKLNYDDTTFMGCNAQFKIVRPDES